MLLLRKMLANSLQSQISEKTRDHLVRTAGNGDPMYEVCIRYRIPRAWEQKSVGQEEEADTRIIGN